MMETMLTAPMSDMPSTFSSIFGLLHSLTQKNVLQLVVSITQGERVVSNESQRYLQLRRPESQTVIAVLI